MRKSRIVFEAEVPAGRREPWSRTPHAAWAHRREVPWAVHVEDLGGRATEDPGRCPVTVAVINAGERHDGERLEVMRMTVDVATPADGDAETAGRRVLDMAPRADGAIAGDARTPLPAPASPSVIGPMPPAGPLGRRLTGYMASLPGGGDVADGMSAWQLNDGSWVLLPHGGAAGITTITTETLHEGADLSRLDLTVTHRAAADDVDAAAGVRREGPQVVRFETRPDGFVLEAGDERRSWRFEMDRPDATVDVSASWLLVHDVHLDA